MVMWHTGLHPVPAPAEKCTIEYCGCGGGTWNVPSVDLNAMAVNIPPDPVTDTVGAANAPGGTFNPMASPIGNVVNGALQEFQLPALFACISSITTSVPESVSPTPVQVG